MKRIHLFGLLTFACVGLATQAHADNWTADFSSSTLDPKLVLTGASDWTATSGGGILEFSSPGNTTTKMGASYLPYLSGDFTASVTVNLQDVSNVAGRLYFSGDAGSGLMTNMTAYKWANLPGFPEQFGNIGGYDPVTKTFPPNLRGLGSVLTLQISRTGDVFTESYMASGDSNFTLWHTFDASAWHGIGGRVGLAGYQSQPMLMTADIKFSEFTVTTPVPEPETYAMLLAGLGLLATIARHRKQRRIHV